MGNHLLQIACTHQFFAVKPNFLYRNFVNSPSKTVPTKCSVFYSFLSAGNRRRTGAPLCLLCIGIIAVIKNFNMRSIFVR